MVLIVAKCPSGAEFDMYAGAYEVSLVIEGDLVIE